MNSNFNTLSSVLTRNNLSDIVCKKEERYITWQTFLSDISRLCQKLNSEVERGKYLLYCSSSYHFAVALFSVWQTGSICVLPPNNSREVIKKFENYVCAFITDQPDCDTELKKIDPIQTGTGECAHLHHIAVDKVLLELFTSGTTGERKCVRKTISNLDAELQVLNNTFGPALKNARTFSTVSHQHIYGLLHKVLLPLCTNRMFIDETYYYPEKLIVDMNDGECDNVLISGPAHLKLLPELVNLSGFNKFCKAVFSSGSLLDSESARKFSFQSGINPIEVLGSTETGGVAWRSQCESAESKLWTPLQSVEIRKSEDGFLQVKSPFIFGEDSHEPWLSMGDLVDTFNDNRFCLYGRGDRIVKIGEKRISLEEMEKVLKTLRNVKSCIVFPITRNHDGYERMLLACAVETLKPVDRNERKMVIDDFKAQLLQHFAQILVPKYWRFVKKMPMDAQGKTSIEELKKLFIKRSPNV